MAGNIESTLSLQMQANTKAGQAELSKLAAEFAALSKSVQSINVSLIGLTPATQAFIKDLQATATQASASKKGIEGFVAVDVKGGLSKSQVATTDLNKALGDTANASQGASTGMKSVSDGASVKGLQDFKVGLSGVSSEAEVLKVGFSEMITVQREQTAALRSLATSMESLRQNGVKLDESNKSWISTIKEWAMAAYYTVGTYNQVNTAVDEHKSKNKEATKTTTEAGEAAKVAAQSYGVWSEDISKVAANLLDFNKSAKESQQQVTVLQASFDTWALNLSGSIESGLKRSSTAFQKFVTEMGDSLSWISAWKAAFGSATGETAKQTISFIDKMEQAWEDYIESLSGNAVKYPTMMKPLSQAEKDFLAEHVTTWDSIKTVTDDYTAKFGTEMPQNMRRAYLEMRTGVQPEIYAMIELAAAAGTSITDLSTQIKDKFGAELAGQLGSYFTKVSGAIQGNLSGVASNIQAVIPLQEQLAKAGNADTETKLALYKQYNTDLAAQTKAITEAVYSTLTFTEAQVKESKAKYDAAAAAQAKAKADLDAGKAAGQSKEEIAALNKTYEESKNATNAAKSSYDVYAKAIAARTAEIKKSVDDNAAAIKKQTEELSGFAKSLSAGLGTTQSELSKLLATQLQGDTRIKANLQGLSSEITAKEQQMNAFRTSVVQGTFATKEQLIASLLDMTGQTDQSMQATVKSAEEKLKAAQDIVKQMADAQNKAIQDSVKSMEAAVSAGFTELKRQSTTSFEAMNVDIQKNKQEWHDAQAANRDDIRLSQTGFDAYATSLKKASTDLATQTTARFSEIRQAIQTAMNAGDTKTVDALKKELADFAQSSITQYKALASEVKSTYESLKSAQHTLIEQMKQKETEWSNQRTANEELIRTAVETTIDRSRTAYEKYQATLNQIQANRTEISRLEQVGDQESLQRAEELSKKNIQLAQTLKDVKMSTYDEMSLTEKENYDLQVKYLQSITNRNAEQEAQLKVMLGMKTDYITYIGAEEAQQKSLNLISEDATKLQELQNAKEIEARDRMQEQLALQKQQISAMGELSNALNATIKAAQGEITFALDTAQAEGKIQKLMEARTIVVNADGTEAKNTLDQILGPRTIDIKFNITDDGAFRIEPIARFSAGGFMPGYGGGDKNVIAVESGEFIHPKESVAHYGLDFMESIRRQKYPRGFQTGGFVAPSVSGVLRSLSHKTKNVRGFKDGGLVTDDSTVTAVVEALEKVTSEIGSNLDSQLTSMTKAINSTYEDIIEEQDSSSKKQTDRLKSAASQLESTLTTPFNVTVKVQQDGTGTASVGSWSS